MANTQTAVPLFVANAVLTAAQQNISAATGVPVFATTVTRDAAFGGSNKALAEGQLCYLESTNVVQYYDGTAWATVGPTASKVAQVLSTTKTDTFTMSSATYADVTGLSVSITPTLNTSKILVMAQVSANAFGCLGYGQFMRGSTAIGVGDASGNRVQCTFGFASAATATIITSSPLFLDSPATTSATTYKIQVRSENTTAIYVNRSTQDDNSVAGGRAISTITVMEILA